ncbi:MAG: DnaD domain protein [Clostridia bacterium]|nr:DnaD domain protein [Clostridia bacterium]
MPKFNADFDFIPVSADFIENDMPSANGAYVKVYLLALSLAFSHREMTTADIAQKLNLLESDVVNAFEYWKEKGVLNISGDNILFGSSQPTEEKPVKKNIEQISDAMTNNKALADLGSLSQEIIGKTLKNKDIETLYWFYDELGLSPEVIIMLLEYCVSKDKRNMNYIEKVAISWHEKGIVTIEAANKLITDEKEKNGYIYSLRKLFGIDNRNLSKTEENFLKKWKDELGMDENMVALAYEYCVMHTGKLSFPYMNSIIERWYKIGIRTIVDAKKDHDDFKNKNKKNNLDVYDDNLNYDELEKIMQNKM